MADIRFFRRLRILSSGTIIEDISEFNRCQELFTILINKNSKVNIDAEGFGLPAWDYTTAETIANFPGIPGGQSQTVVFTPLSGILSQSKFLPLRYCNLVFELELVSDNTIPFVRNDLPPIPPLVLAVFNPANTSDSWKIQNVQVKVDVLTLDNTMENGFVSHLLSGKSLPICYSTYISSFQSILTGDNGQQKTRVNISRSLSRLKSVFITLDKENTTPSAVYKEFNNFYSPMMTNNNNTILGSAGEIEFQLQLANKLYPEYPIRSHAEAFYQLRKTLGVQSSALHSFNISAQEYKRRKFVLAIDTEVLLSMAFTGKNTKSGELLNIRLDNLGTDGTKYAHGIYTILHADCIMEVLDSGIRVSD